MPKPELDKLAAELEAHLGDPHDPASRMPFERILDHDEREEYPYPFVNLLQRWGVHEYNIPAAQGGRAATWRPASTCCASSPAATRPPPPP
ncbi:hypothetical protein ACFQ1I_19940 [Kitasatospora arboriphila]